ncbi:MAG: hypothetical protein GW795_02730 [Cyanobacteria bacterium]|nr:hypothetical protein [Cyanobacteria bacterium CG_2015-16_32_12]NCO76773.1 hypothetical protein [Cyanobacteria bacterium CG_2015-22_32_23]NCQ03907.1 hypothetical protein [Cyanobacteria bacterium CG_2015-09_32_10]NCQ40817.1 hypothetical protein [Cyanobacteria bacterium CG_2015-04_32_10]NCS85287.1 hypothetical protein [Cyanobacteria bacterium CG_2015-02_32_10]
MDIQEFKILLKLLDKTDYRGKIGEIKPNDKTKVSVVRNLCEQLFNRGYIDVEEKILQIKINNNGKTLLKNKALLDKENNLELIILNSCLKTSIKPSDIKLNPASKRDQLIADLVKKELIEIKEKQIIFISLTSNGKLFLAQEFLCKGLGNINLSKKLLNNYLTFIRNCYTNKDTLLFKSDNFLESPDIITSELEEIKEKNKPSIEEVLETIIQLDLEFNTDNYLPIFYVRNKYQSILNRQELDTILYSLQKQNKLSMSRLVDGSQYNSEEYNAGIPQKIGGPIFYLIVK